MGFDISGSVKGQIALLFPGQGSQSVGMMDTFRALPIVSQAIEECSDALNENLFELIDNGPEASLNLTKNTQPIMLACSVAIWRLFSERCRDLKPSYFAGHSLGEYSALTAAKTFSLTEAAELVRYRAEVMQSITSPGDCGMVAVIGFGLEHIEKLCTSVNESLQSSTCRRGEKEYPQIVEVANINSEKQVVLSGSKLALELAVTEIKNVGTNTRIVELPVSAPFHSSILKPVEDLLSKKFESLLIKEPEIPTISNYHAEVYGSVEEIRKILPKQAFSAVQWKASIEKMISSGVEVFIECGPGKVLSGLVRQMDRTVKVLGLQDFDSLCKTAEYVENFGKMGAE